jgi:plasmid stabilization system protein ParE
MKGFWLSPQAYQDIDKIWEFISQKNLDAADRVRDRIFEAFENWLSYLEWGTFARTLPKSRFGFGLFSRT